MPIISPVIRASGGCFKACPRIDLIRQVLFAPGRREPMNLAALELTRTSQPGAVAAARLSGIVLVRLATAPEGREEADLARDLLPIISHKLSPEDWRKVLSGILASLAAASYVSSTNGRARTTGSGRTAAAEFLGLRKATAMPAWPDVRDGALIARALGLEKEPASRLKGLAKLDGLRCLIVLGVHALKLRGPLSASRLRSALAVIALERAFGNQIKHSLGEKPGLSPKSGRLLAGQLASKPRDFGTDGRLIAALAADAVEAPRSDIGTLRLGVLRRFITNAETKQPAAPTTPKPRSSRVQKAKESDAALPSRPSEMPAPVAQAVATPVSHRPDPAQFARAVLAAARAKAEGWPGNRKAYVSHVWNALRDERPEWALTEIEFKCMLTEAHRTGLLTLANADLKNPRALKELQDSAISYKNTIWHFIRVED
jgi:hypothetical protein